MNRPSDMIEVTSTVNGYSTGSAYWLAPYIPSKNEKLHRDYVYYTLLDVNSKGLLFRIHGGYYAREIDFKVCTIGNRRNIDRDNTIFFLKGDYHTDKRVFKDIKTGGEFNNKLTEFSFEPMLAKNIIEFVKLYCDGNSIYSNRRY